MLRPTKEQFQNFEALFDYFNKNLFDGNLPNVILNFSRKSGTAGFFSPNNWQSADGKTTHEISINPNTFSNGKVYIIQTLVHEMVHLWQEEFGEPGSKKSKNYHNRQWADKMIEVGLIPSHNGEVGGKQIGTRMSDYLEKGGVLDQLIEKMPNDIWYPFETLMIVDVKQLEEMLELEEDPVKVEEIKEQIEEFEEAIEQAKKKHKSKYTCASCEVNVWGKADLQILCGVCGNEFYETRPE